MAATEERLAEQVEERLAEEAEERPGGAGGGGVGGEGEERRGGAVEEWLAEDVEKLPAVAPERAGGLLLDPGRCVGRTRHIGGSFCEPRSNSTCRWVRPRLRLQRGRPGQGPARCRRGRLHRRRESRALGCRSTGSHTKNHRLVGV